MRPRRSLSFRSAFCAEWGLLLMLSACCESAPDPLTSQNWPEGTVLVCDGEPIRAEEVDPIALALQPLGPRFTQPHLRRLALTNVCLPLAAGRAKTDLARLEEARAEAEAFLSGMSQNSPPEAPVEIIDGAQDGLGLPLWVLIQRQELGAWSAVEELPGRFVVVRLLEKNDDPQPQRTLYKVEIASFFYVDVPSSLTSAARNASYVIVNPSWEALIPGSWRYYKSEIAD